MFTSFSVSGLSINWFADKVPSNSVETVRLESLPALDRSLTSAFDVESFPEAPDTPDTVCNTILKNIDLYTMIESALTPRQFRVFQLHYIFGRTQLEIARILNIAQPSVNMVLRASMYKLRKKLKGIDSLLTLK